MKISLIISAYNEEKYIGECLESAIKNSRGGFHEIIVVDNASTDKTKEIALSFPGVIVVEELEKGLTRARQRGLESATGDLLAYTDADTRLPEKWIDDVRIFFKENPDAVSLSGPYKYFDGSKFRNLIITGFWWISAPVTYFFVGYMILGGNFVAKKDALLVMGGFDKTIDFYGEDTDIARRLSKFGRVVFKMNFPIYSSSRRFAKEGTLKTSAVYAINFIWQIFFKKPFTKKYKDIRSS